MSQKRPIHIFNLFLGLVLLCFFSCVNTAVTTQLNLVDSLLAVNQNDSALKVFNSIDAGELSGSEQNAFYGLLFTQAQYKNYIKIQSDSLINLAVDYYERRPEDRARLSQAYMYKGAAMVDMGVGREAVDWYKKAEMAADSNDYLTLGLVNFRLGELYQRSHNRTSESIDRYAKALQHFQKAEHSAYECYTLSYLGQTWIAKSYDSAYVYLNRAVDLAKKHDYKQELYLNYLYIAKLFDFHNANLSQAKNYLLEVYKNHQYIGLDASLIYSISVLYAKLGNVDSAAYYANQMPILKNSYDTLRYYMTVEQIAKAKKDFKSAYENYYIAEHMADSLVRNSESEEFYAIEKQFDNTIANQRAESYRHGYVVRNYIIVVSSLAIIIIMILLYVVVKRRNIKNQDNLMLIARLQNEAQQASSALAAKLDKESKLKQVLDNQVKSIKQLIEVSYRSGGNAEKFMEKFRDSVKVNKMPDGLWKDLRFIVDEQYNGIISRIVSLHPQLENDDLNLICLMCCGFSYIEMTTCLGYANERSTCNKRMKVTRKMGLDVSLEEYIKKMM